MPIGRGRIVQVGAEIARINQNPDGAETLAHGELGLRPSSHYLWLLFSTLYILAGNQRQIAG